MCWVCGCLNLVTNRCIQILVDLIIGTSYIDSICDCVL